MKQLFYLTLIGCMCVLNGCSDNKPTLYVYNWSDYLDPELIAKFEEENNCHVNVDTFADNESMLAKLLAGGGGYDLIFPSSYATPVMYKHNLIDDLDMSLLPNVATNLDQKFKAHFHTGILKYSVPYAFSVTGIVYRKDKIPKDYVVTNSWDLLKAPIFTGRVCMFRDVREVLGIGLRITGKSVNTVNAAEIAEALKVVQSFKQYASKLDNEQYRTGIISGEMFISMGYACDVLQLMGESPDTPIEFIIPDEGSTCCWDEMVIAKQANNKELAYKFIDYLYRPDVAAANAEYICATVPNKAMWAYVSDEVKSNEWFNVSEATLKKLELIQDVGPNIELYNRAWDVFTTNTH